MHHITKEAITAYSVSGKAISLQDFHTRDINWRDLAHHLALCNVLAGATEIPVSFAQLSLITAKVLLAQEREARIVLAGLVDVAPLAFDPLRTDRGLFIDFTSSIKVEILRSLNLNSLGNLAAHQIIEAYNIALNTVVRDMSRIEPSPNYGTFREPVKQMPWLAAETAWLDHFDIYCRAAGVTPKEGSL